MAFTDQITLADDATFRGRVRQALVTAAINVMAEDSQTANYVARRAYATRVLHSATLEAQSVTYGIVTNGAITDQSTDNDIQFTVNSMFDAYAATPGII